MTRDEWVSAVGTGIWADPPADWEAGEVVELLVDQAMSCIRSDLVRAGHLASGASRLSKALGSKLHVGISFRTEGHVALLSGKARQAIRRYEASRANLIDHPSERASVATAMLQALAYVGRYEDAFALGQEARDFYADEGEMFRSARIDANVANLYLRLDRHAEARELYESALEGLASAGATDDLAVVYRNYGVCLMSLQDFEAAERMYSTARATFVANEQQNLVFEVDLNTCYLLGRTGRVREALAGYRRLLGQLPGEASFEIGHSLLDQADFMLEIGMWTDAEHAAGAAAGVFAACQLPFEQGKAKLLQGLSRVRAGALDAARDALQEAGRRLRREPNQNWRALLAAAEGELLEAGGSIRRARQRFRRALDAGPSSERTSHIKRHLLRLEILLGDADRTELDELDDPVLEAMYWRLAGRPDLASAWATRAVEELARERERAGTTVLRHALMRSRQDRLLEALRSAEAPLLRMRIVGMAKGDALAEAIGTNGASLTLRPDLWLSDNAFRNRTDASTSEAAEEDVSRMIRAEALETATPSLAGPAPAQELAKASYIEFFELDGRMRAITMGAQGPEEHDLAAAQTVADRSRWLRFHLGRHPLGVGDAEISEILSWLAQHLAPAFVGPEQAVVVGACKSLAGVPLHAIKAGPLGLKAISYAPSFDAWGTVRSRPACSGRGALFVGAGDDLAPMIEAEIHAASAAVAGRVLPHDAALGLLDEEVCGVSIVHIAAHGIHREDRPLFSSVKVGSGQWSALDLMHLRLQGQTVVLSGCSSGLSDRGELFESEGLVEALLVAGASCVIGSQWDVDDAAAHAWMCSFYEACSRHGQVPVGQAYREACVAAALQNGSPAAWGAFALYGDAFTKISV